MPENHLPVAIQKTATEHKVVIEGTEVLRVPSTAAAVALVFGLTYVMNIQYPKDLKFTFEFFQKVFMELDMKKMSAKLSRVFALLE